MNDDQDDMGLGYKRPPVWARFKSGQSGNPKGRPPKAAKKAADPASSSELDDLLRTELDRTIVVNEGGRKKEMTMRQAVVRSQIATAAKGNRAAQLDVIRMAGELEARDAARAEQEQVIARGAFNNAVAWKRERAAIWEAASAEGTEPEQPWPHPDDILLNNRKHHWTVRGPYDARDVARFEYYRAERDHNFAESIILMREQKRKMRGLPDAFIIVWQAWDAMLPLRWQIIDDFEPVLFVYFEMRLSRLRQFARKLETRCETLKEKACIPPPDKESYQMTNKLFKPLIKRFGFRSLAEFENHYAQTTTQK
jgi:Family of unknown function (DUF5681)